MQVRQFFSDLKSSIWRKFVVAKYSLKKKFKAIPDEAVKYIRVFVFYVFAYGLLINYSLNIVLKNIDFISVQLGPLSIPAWGILYYFLKLELPELIKNCR